MAKKNYDEMSKQILDLVGGKQNVAQMAGPLCYPFAPYRKG